MELSLPTLEKQSTDSNTINSCSDSKTKQWIDRITNQQLLMNQNRIKMYKPKYKLTLWDIREVFDCRIRRIDGKHQLLFTIEIANAPNRKIEVAKIDINGSTVTRGDIFVRFFKSRYGVDNTHQLEQLLVDRLNEKNIELLSETDEPQYCANIPQLKPQTIKNATNNPKQKPITVHDDTTDDDEVHIISNAKCTSNSASGQQQSPQILSITPITPSISKNNNRGKKRPIRSMLLSGTSTGNPFMDTARTSNNQRRNNTLSLPSLTEAPSPSLHSYNSSKSTCSSSSYPFQPPSKRRKVINNVTSVPIQLNLLINPTMTANNNNNNNNNKNHMHSDALSHNALYTKTKLKLEEMIKLQRMENEKSAYLSCMNSWCNSMINVENGALQLLTMYAAIQQESERFKSIIANEKAQFENLEKENNVRNQLQTQMGQNLNRFTKQLTAVDAQIRQLVIERQRIQQNIGTTTRNINENKVMMDNYGTLKQRYISAMSDRVKQIQDAQSFLPVIKNITNRYQDTINKLRNNLCTFESEWRQWNSQHVLQWIKHIENGKFNDNMKYATFVNYMIRNKIKGSDFEIMNDTILRDACGIKDDRDRRLIMNNIDRLRRRNRLCTDADKTNVLLRAIEMLEAEDRKRNDKCK